MASPQTNQSTPCPECDGTTWKRVVKDGVDVVTRCECRLGDLRSSVMEKTGVPGRYLECAFDARSGGKPFDRLRPSLARAHKVAEGWADKFPDVDAGLLLSGPPGVGKTHLSVAILRRILLERKIQAPALFADYRSLLRDIKRSYHPDAPATESDVLRPVLDAEPLVLDDMGGENPTLWVFDTLFYILNYRYNEKKLTIITTNFSDRATKSLAGREETLADRVTVRLRSRLYEMCRDVSIAGDDYRQSAVQANFTS
jgi:DNA replication protein DnaC